MHPLCSLGGSLKWKERAAFLLASFIFGLSGLYGSYLGDTTCKLCAVVTDACSFKLSAAARRLRSRILGWRQYVFRLYHFLSESGPIKRATPVTQFFVMLLASAGREIWDNTSCYDWTDATVGWHCCYLLMKSLYGYLFQPLLTQLRNSVFVHRYGCVTTDGNDTHFAVIRTAHVEPIVALDHSCIDHCDGKLCLQILKVTTFWQHAVLIENFKLLPTSVTSSELCSWGAFHNACVDLPSSDELRGGILRSLTYLSFSPCHKKSAALLGVPALCGAFSFVQR